MYAIVEIAGQQFKAEKGRKLYVHRLPQAEGSVVSFAQVLLLEDDGKVKVGTPNVKDVAVEAKILRHLKDDKVIVFKKNRRKGYKVKNGHRQCLTQILIEGIGAAKAAPVSAPVVAAPKAEVKAEKAVAPKAAAPKKPTAAQPATEKAAAPKKAVAPKKPKTIAE